jgi:hypothetical protein
VAGAILVLSQPAGATVELDGHPLGEATPMTAGGVRGGKHTVRLSSPGYAPVEQLVLLREGERAGVDVVLPPASRAVEVLTDPAGALVYLDGHLVAGQTPLHVELAEDDFHEVRVEKTGYELISESIKPEDKRTRISFDLSPERKPRGTVWVDGSHVAAVFIDGANSGLVTPTPGIQVPIGEHVIELRDGHDHDRLIASAKVKLAKGQTVHLNLTPAAKRP